MTEYRVLQAFTSRDGREHGVDDLVSLDEDEGERLAARRAVRRADRRPGLFVMIRSWRKTVWEPVEHTLPPGALVYLEGDDAEAVQQGGHARRLGADEVRALLGEGR